MKHTILKALLFVFLLVTAGTACAQQKGMASYYGKALHGRKTSSGERFDMYAMTCAHRTLPFGTWINVRDVKTGKEVKVRVTDRGPFCKGRVVDLSYGAARDLGIVGRGVAQVEVTVVPSGKEEPATKEDLLREPERMMLELKLYDPKTGNYYAVSEWTRRELEAKEAAKQQQRHWRVLNDKLTAKVFK